MFSILIPTYNNLEYLKICLNSLKNNSYKNHEVIIHINEGSDGTLKYVKENDYLHTYSKINIGLCSALNIASKLSSKKYILYSHDDMYFCPGWDEILIKEVKNIKHDKFYLSGTMVQKSNGHINYDCGDSYYNFDEKKFLNNFEKINYYDHQGSHFAPHLTTKKMWDKVNGLSEEFNPGMGSDPDLNMKLWNQGVRIFKGINNFKVYHFSTVTSRKRNIIKRNNGKLIFFLKWGITINHFVKFYLQRQEIYKGPLTIKKNFFYYLSLIICKLKYPFYYILYKNKNEKTYS